MWKTAFRAAWLAAVHQAYLKAALSSFHPQPFHKNYNAKQENPKSIYKMIRIPWQNRDVLPLKESLKAVTDLEAASEE